MLTRARLAWDQCVAAGAPLEVLDIGGVFPAPYRTGVMSLSDYCRHLSTALDATFGDLPIRIIAEPGRWMCAEAATLITRVVGKSVRGGLPWYFLDEGIYGSFSGKLFDYQFRSLTLLRTVSSTVSQRKLLSYLYTTS